MVKWQCCWSWRWRVPHTKTIGGTTGHRSDLCLTLSLVVTHLVLPICPVRSCRSVEEGDSLRIDCDGLNHHGYSTVTWTDTSPSGVETPLPHCPSEETYCQEQFQTDINLSNWTSHSTMYASNLDRSHHGHTMHCRTQDNSSLDRTLSQCTLDIYQKPRDPICVATKLDEHTVHVKCTTTDVFPGLFCSITEIEDLTHSTRTWTKDQLQYRSSSDSGVHICEYQPDVLLNGTYLYIGIMWPRAKNVDLRTMSIPAKLSKAVSISSHRVNVRLLPETLKHTFCLDTSKDIEIYADAFEFLSQPEVLWTKGGQKLSSSNSTISPIWKGGTIYMYTSILRLRVSELDDGQEVSFSAGLKSSTGDRHVKATEILELLWPPREKPLFFDFTGERVPDTVEVNVDSGLNMFQCHISGGKPIVEQIHVKCASESKGRNRTMHEFLTRGYRLEFTLEGKAEETWVCHCSGHHVTGRECYTGMSSLSIQFSSANKKAHATSDMALPIAMVLGLIATMAVFIIVIGVCLFKCRTTRREEEEEMMSMQ